MARGRAPISKLRSTSATDERVRAFAREQLGWSAYFIGPSNSVVLQLGGFPWRRWESPVYGAKKITSPSYKLSKLPGHHLALEQRRQCRPVLLFFLRARALLRPPDASVYRDNTLAQATLAKSAWRVAGFFIAVYLAVRVDLGLVKACGEVSHVWGSRGNGLRLFSR